MVEIKFGDGQYVIYANSEQEAGLIIGKELARFDRIKYLMSELVIENEQSWQNFMNNSSEERLNIYFNDETSFIYGEDSTAKGEVRRVRPDDENGYFSYDLAYRYPDIQGHNADFRLAHEMGHLMLNPSSADKQTYDKDTQTIQVAGLIRVPINQENNRSAFYGEEMQENALNLLAQLAIRGNHSADDIITGKIDLSEFNSYKRCDDLVKLLVISMRNDFDKEMSFEQLMKKKIDSTIKHSDGTQEPANIFLYGMLNDSSIIQKEFDKYMGNEAWKKLNSDFKDLYNQNISKERFEEIFKNVQGIIVQFANTRMQDKYKEAELRDGAANIPGLNNKIKMIQEITGKQNINALSLKQKVAQFLRNRNIFMNLKFVENFVNKQLNVLSTENQHTTVDKSRKTFEEWISGNGLLKDNLELPTSQRKSDPKIMAKIQNKMNKKTDGR